MVTRYSDAWLRQQFTPDRDRFTVETPPDPEHGDMTDVSGPVVMIEAPVLQSGGEIFTDAVFENYQHLPVTDRIDETPVEGHGTGHERGRGYGNDTRPYGDNEQYGREEMGAVRGDNLGAPRRGTSMFGQPYQFYNEQWFGTDTTGFEPPPITHGPGDKVLRRGLNGYPENDGSGGRPRSWTVNMPSWKRGNYHNTNVNRDFTPPNRTHSNVRMNRPDIVTIIGDAPPPDRPDKYASPFSSLQKFLPKRRSLRGIRRTPGPWDEQTLASFPEPTSAGVSADGMVIP